MRRKRPSPAGNRRSAPSLRATNWPLPMSGRVTWACGSLASHGRVAGPVTPGSTDIRAALSRVVAEDEADPVEADVVVVLPGQLLQRTGRRLEHADVDALPPGDRAPQAGDLGLLEGDGVLEDGAEGLVARGGRRRT